MKNTTLLAALGLALSTTTFAQSRVTGRVVASDGTPVQAVRVLPKGYDVLAVDPLPEGQESKPMRVTFVAPDAVQFVDALRQEEPEEEPVVWAVDAMTDTVIQSGDGWAVDAPDEKTKAKRDIKSIVDAMKALDERGYTDEAARLREILDEIISSLQPKSMDERAATLLAGDIQDRAVRVGMIELAAEGYGAAGWESAAEAMYWFAAIGRAQVNGEPQPAGGIPEAARGGNGNIMDRMVELVLGAAGVHQQLGNPKAADACMALGRFYVMRALGAFDEERKVSWDTLDEPAGTFAIGVDAGGLEAGQSYRLVAPRRGGGDIGADVIGVDQPLQQIGYAGEPTAEKPAAEQGMRVTFRGLGYGGDVQAQEVEPDTRAAATLGALGYAVDVTTEETQPKPDAEENGSNLRIERRRALNAEIDALRAELERLRSEVEKRRIMVEEAEESARRGGNRIRRR